MGVFFGVVGREFHKISLRDAATIVSQRPMHILDDLSDSNPYSCKDTAARSVIKREKAKLRGGVGVPDFTAIHHASQTPKEDGFTKMMILYHPVTDTSVTDSKNPAGLFVTLSVTEISCETILRLGKYGISLDGAVSSSCVFM